MSRPDLILGYAPNGWRRYSCTAPGCAWEYVFIGEGTTAEREGQQHIENHPTEMKVAEFMTVRGGMGNDAFAAMSNLVSISRVMFANEGIDLKTVETFRASVKRNHDFDANGGDVIPIWDTFAEVTYPAPADEAADA
jgi:hypothetical protein